MKFPSLLLIISLFQACSANEDLPVFLIDFDNALSDWKIKPNPFVKINTSHFTDLIRDAVKGSECIIIFVEDTFCSEDIRMKDKLGSPYNHLHQGLLDKNIKYIPAVTEPYKTLNTILQPNQFNIFFLSFGEKLQVLNTLQYFYIFFKDGANETRAESLRKHDVIITDVYSSIRRFKNAKIVAFYTGKVNPITLEQIEYVPPEPISEPEDLEPMVVTEGALFKLTGKLLRLFM